MRIRSCAPAAVALCAWIGVVQGCGGDKDKKDVDTEEGVMDVYAAFQPTILKIMSAGLAAKAQGQTQGANINPITIVGFVTGTGGIGGSVAQSSGQNQNLNLFVSLVAYSDTGNITFTTDNTDDTTKLQFDLQVTNQPPDNMMDGTLVGQLTVDGDVEGTADFNLTHVSDLEDDDGAPALICTHVTGTVDTEDDDPLEVDFVLPARTLDSAENIACSQL